MLGHHTGTVPYILLVTWPLSETASADFHAHAPTSSD